MTAQDCCVWNGGSGAWAFQPLAAQLAEAIGIDVSETPRRFSYLLQTDAQIDEIRAELFIPLGTIQLASDKRLLARAFEEHRVATPVTRILDSFERVSEFVRENAENEWCLKYPTGCGATGHRLLTKDSVEIPEWPRPFIVQEFVRMERPEVHRIFCAANELFGWVARRYPDGVAASPWVAHARGARYVNLGIAPAEAQAVARDALTAAHLLTSFGCVDLICRPTGEWLVLEVGTDGLFNHVDRELADPDLEQDLVRRVARSFWLAASAVVA